MALLISASLLISSFSVAIPFLAIRPTLTTISSAYAQEVSRGQPGVGNQTAPPTTTKQPRFEPPSQVRIANETAAKEVAAAAGVGSVTNKTLPSSQQTDTGTESKNINNWITANHDIYGTRFSNQTAIGKDNVKNLKVKWILETGSPVENPPIIVGHRGYALTNAGTIVAFDTTTGLNLWNVKTGGTGYMHGMTFNNGILFTGTGSKGTVLAVNATSGEKVWESSVLGPTKAGYGVIAAPIVWHNIVVVGSAGGDFPPNLGEVQGNITALDRTSGKVVWNFKTTTGEWVGPGKVPPNGGATTWTGGVFDPQTGLIFMPAGNPSPDFNATTWKGMPTKYANHMLAVNITNGKLKWATPFISFGTQLKDVTLPDTHDWDTSWGASVSTVRYDNGTEHRVVMGHVVAMDALTGSILWSRTLGTTYRTEVPPKPEGSGPVWPGTGQGAESYHAVDSKNNTAYFATSSMGYNFFVNGTEGWLVPEFNAIKNGIGNGTITAIDMKTGKTKWEYPTEFPTYFSPLVTNGLVFAGHFTDIGKPYPFNTFGNPTDTKLRPSSIFFVLDADTGKKLWEFNVGGPLGVGGASVGDGMVFVTTGSPSARPSYSSGSIVAFAPQ
jgi:alcohol dehydrogenase (cytochrome c)